VLTIEKRIIYGAPDPDRIRTSHVERQNLNIRMAVRRLTRLTNAFSKKRENHQAALALYFAYYNFCHGDPGDGGWTDDSKVDAGGIDEGGALKIRICKYDNEETSMAALRFLTLFLALVPTVLAQRKPPQCDLYWKPTSDGHCQLLTADVTGNLILKPVAPKTIPSWWLSSDPKKVLADPEFYKLSINERVEILQQIDRKFTKHSFRKLDGYLWEAETANLPKAAPPKQVVPCNSSDPTCTADLSYNGKLTRQIQAAGIRVNCTLDSDGFVYAHIRVQNDTTSPLSIRPQTFVMNVLKPKVYVLYFEYPMRVYWQSQKAASHFYPNYIPGEPARPQAEETYAWARQGMYQHSATIEEKALYEVNLPPNSIIEGNVYFQTDYKAREVVVRAFIGDFAFDFPFSLPKR
jgi:hypothetical protein